MLLYQDVRVQSSRVDTGCCDSGVDWLCDGKGTYWSRVGNDTNLASRSQVAHREVGQCWSCRKRCLLVRSVRLCKYSSTVEKYVLREFRMSEYEKKLEKYIDNTVDSTETRRSGRG